MKASSLSPGGLVAVIVDAGKTQEDGDGGPQLGQEVAHASAQPLIHGGQQPGPYLLLS